MKKYLNKEKPIVARATPMGRSAIAIIRCSGEGIIQIIEKLFHGKQPFSQAEPRSMQLGWMIHPETGEKIDQVMTVLFRAPASYTGEDMVEIYSHGGNYVCQCILDLLTRHGCISARPGDFSRRAFLNEKIDLFQAEAISEIICARTEEQRKMAISQMDPDALNPLKEIKLELEESLMLVESRIEFPEENHGGKWDFDILIKILGKNFVKVSDMCKAFERGIKIREGIHIPIIGIPNAGKSSLFNWLCKSEKVIVDSEPGTTRDSIEEELDINGEKVVLVDTAGIRENAETIEKKGIEKTRFHIKKADAVIWVHDATSLKSEEKVLEKSFEKKVFHVYNKMDLLGKKEKCPGYCVSIITGEGLEKFLKDFEEAIKEIMESGLPAFSANAFQNECLLEVKEKLEETIERYKTGEAKAEETISIELRDILSAMDPLLGKITSEEVLDRIFSNYCIGK